MNVFEAKQKTFQKRIESIELRIDNAIESGKFTTGTGFNLYPQEVEHFEKQGFKVKSGNLSGKSWFVISWE